MRRREFLRSIAATTAGAMAIPSWLRAAGPSSRPDRRPNILFILGDDNAWPHLSCYGDKVVRTPTIDGLARDGAIFSHAFCCAPTCTASRAGILTGQTPHRLGESINLWGTFANDKYKVYPDLLAKTGYRVGFAGKGYGPGTGEKGNPAGPGFNNFDEFLKTVPADGPFCFWFGSHHPHRGKWTETGAAAGLKAEDVQVPPWLPDDPIVRNDILDYYRQIELLDKETADLLKALDQTGRADNTVVVFSGDNGMPFPRAKATLYDSGCRQPLIIRWPGRVKPGRKIGELVSLVNLAPTFLAAAGVNIPDDMTGRSLVDLLTGKADALPGPSRVFFERDRHVRDARKGGVGYPARAIRTGEFLYIRNFAPDRWPMGDPGKFADIDAGPAKQFVLDHKDDAKFGKFFEMACGKQPAEELFDLKRDPDQLSNVAGKPEYAETQKKLSAELAAWMASTADPLAKGVAASSRP